MTPVGPTAIHYYGDPWCTAVLAEVSCSLCEPFLLFASLSHFLQEGYLPQLKNKKKRRQSFQLCLKLPLAATFASKHHILQGTKKLLQCCHFNENYSFVSGALAAANSIEAQNDIDALTECMKRKLTHDSFDRDKPSLKAFKGAD